MAIDAAGGKAALGKLETCQKALSACPFHVKIEGRPLFSSQFLEGLEKSLACVGECRLPSLDQAASRSCAAEDWVRLRVTPCSTGTL